MTERMPRQRGLAQRWFRRPPADRGVRPLVPFWLALLLAAAAGPVLDAAFPSLGLWPLAFVGIGMLLVALRGIRPAWAFLLGSITGLTFTLLHIEWATLFLGPVPWAALSVLEALFFGVAGLLIALSYRLLLPLRRRGPLRLIGVPVVVAACWTTLEALRSVWPYGGFAWGRIAQSQSESPIATLFAWLGTSGVGFVMVLAVAMVIEAALDRRSRVILRVVPAAAMVALLIGAPAFPIEQQGSFRVAAVQGNQQAGYFQNGDPTENLLAAVDATLPLRGTEVDAVIWPEGVSTLDPTRNQYVAQIYDHIAETFDAPLIGWTVAQLDDEVFNRSLLWRAGEGAVDHFDKRHPVPFGEYVPDRWFWEPLAPDLIGLIGREYLPGTTDAVYDLDGVVAGLAICFDIVDDALLRGSVRDGAQVIIAQTNNADFGRTDQSVQQLAIARIRALELGRSVVNLSTVGTSAIIAPDGSELDRLKEHTVGTMVQAVPLSSTETPALHFGLAIEWVIAALALGGIGAGLTLRARSDRRANEPARPAGPGAETN